MVDYRFSVTCVAEEDLVNNSVCIRDGEKIRNTRSLSELNTELYVFVSNIEPTVLDGYLVSEVKNVIKKGTLVRCFKLRI